MRVVYSASGAQNDTDPNWRQCNLELLEENIIF